MSPGRASVAIAVSCLVGLACSRGETSKDPPPPPELEVMPRRSEAAGAPARLEPAPPRPTASAERIGLPSTPAFDVPTGHYRLALKRTRDGCTPAQTVDATTDAIVVTRKLASGSVVNAPLGLVDPALPQHRIELPLHVGESRVNFFKLHPPKGAASVTVRTTLKELRADGFTLSVEQSFEGLEADALPAASKAAVTRSCLAEHEARFTLDKMLCPASCAVDARTSVDGGATVGDCACPSGRDGG